MEQELVAAGASTVRGLAAASVVFGDMGSAQHYENAAKETSALTLAWLAMVQAADACGPVWESVDEAPHELDDLLGRTG